MMMDASGWAPQEQGSEEGFVCEVYEEVVPYLCKEGRKIGSFKGILEVSRKPTPGEILKLI